MDHLEQENQRLREEVATLQERVERQAAIITTLLAAQNQSSVPLHASTSQAQATIATIPVSAIPCVIPVSQPDNVIPQAAVTYSNPLFHTERVGGDDRVNDL